MTVDEAHELFKAVPSIREKMETLKKSWPWLHKSRSTGNNIIWW